MSPFPMFDGPNPDDPNTYPSAWDPLVAKQMAEQFYPQQDPSLIPSPGLRLGPVRLSGPGLDSAALSVLGMLQGMQPPQGFGANLATGLAYGLASGRSRQAQARGAANEAAVRQAQEFAAKRNEMALRATEAARTLRQHALDRKRELADQASKEVDVYTRKQELDKSLGIGDFKPAKSEAAAPPGLGDYTALLSRINSDNDVQKFQIVRDAWASMKNTPASAAGDVSLIYSFMRINDPGSTVREGEYATAQNAAGVPERIRNIYNRALTGERLTPEQRADFTETAQSIYRSRLPQYRRVVSQYERLAAKFGLDPSLVMRDLTVDDERPPLSSFARP